MTVESPRFGTLTFGEEHVIRLSAGLRDHPAMTEFVIVDEATSEPLRWFVSVADPGFAMPVIGPERVLPDYALDEHLAALEEIFVVVSPATDTAPATIDLRHPIVIQKDTRHGEQLELESPHLSSCHVLHLVEHSEYKR